MFPSADIVTEIPVVDRAIDRLARVFLPRRPGWAEGGQRVVALGFPRSANTFLTYWLRDAARDGVVVLDGRLTHSALDVHRLSAAGVVVVLPVRRPQDALASWMVRRGRPDEVSAARRKLRAYAAWHRVAAKAVGRHRVLVVPFEVAIQSPRACADSPWLRDLLDDVPQRTPEAIVNSMEAELAGESGQGVGVDDIPSEWMISLPRQQRSTALDRARSTLRDPALRTEFARAEAAYKRVLRAAERAGALCPVASDGVAGREALR